MPPAASRQPPAGESLPDDACGEPESLPLLGFVLKRLWDDRFADRLGTSTYEAMHGVSGAFWRRHLCDVVGRDLTQDERHGMPAGLPDRICPA
ncbi:hypothetical protein [Streptomyces sp. NPDC046374]|uniref:nSTAND1 domain-containing NTPase n=1 Tax=unclassified Streptomyces TaxID=2593676 RepID=UPI0033FBD719